MLKFVFLIVNIIIKINYTELDTITACLVMT